MALSAKRKYQFSRILPFGFIWLLLGALFLSIEEMAIGDLTKTDQSAIRLEPDVVLYALVGIFFIGCIFGAIHVLWLDKLFKGRSFGRKLLFEFSVYLLFMEFMLLLNYPIVASMEQDTSLLDSSVWERFGLFFFSVTHLSALLQMSVSIMLSLFYFEISSAVGPNVLYNFFIGKYHRPVNEERIFMFVDMKDSTTIAEKLGSELYFQFLQAYYDSFSSAIINHQGEVYQYVGDEIVISWPKDKGLINNNCIECFFTMKSDMDARSQMFQRRFEIVPDFKAALHCGPITTGEIGALKKDIFFTGDVLNTTSRILGKASVYGENLMVSKDLIQLMKIEDHYDFRTLGTQELKGKSESVDVMAVGKKEN